MDIDYTFSGSSIISMGPSASITVNFSQTLSINNTGISGCDEMWDRIVVFPFATLNLTSSTLEDAETAVVGTFLSSLTVQDNIFRNNHIGLLATNGFTGLPAVSLPQPMTGNSFVTTSTLLPPHTGEIGFAGVQLNNQNGFTIGTTNATAAPNTFENLDNGLIANNSSFAAHGASFKNMPIAASGLPPTNPPRGHGIFAEGNSSMFVTHCDFESMTAGIHGINSSISASFNTFISNLAQGATMTGIRGFVSENAPRIEIFENNIDALRWGVLMVEMGNASQFEIYNNDIEVGDVSVDPVFSGRPGIQVSNSLFSSSISARIENNTIDQHAATSGINVGNCRRLNILDNDITIHPVFGTLVINGIVLTHSNFLNVRDNSVVSLAGTTEPLIESGIVATATTSTKYCCNSVNGIFTGVKFNSTCLGTTFRGTSFGNAQIGLHYTQDARTSTQNNANNQWTGSYGDVAARHETMDIDVFNSSSYRVNPFSPPTLPPSIDANFPNWFSQWRQAPNFSCPSVYCGIVDQEPPQTDEADSLIAVGGWDSGLPYHETWEWGGERYLLAKLDEHPGLLQGSPTLQSFYTNKQGSTADLFNQVEAGIRALADLTPTESAQHKANTSASMALLMDLTDIDEQLYGATGYQADSLRQAKEQAMQELADLQAENDSLHTIIHAARLTAIQQLIIDNNGITAVDTFKQNEKTVNDIWLNTLAQGIYTFTTAQQTALEGIIHQCPQYGGNAVYMARGIYQLIADVDYKDEQVCNALDNRSSNEIRAVESNSFGIYPNPAKDRIEVVLSTASETASMLTLTDLAGKTVQVFDLPTGHARFTLDIGHLPTGVYFCKMEQGGQEAFVQKLVISR